MKWRWAVGLVGYLAGLTLLAAGRVPQEPVVTKARLERETSIDYRHIQHYTVITPQGRFTLSGDGDVPFVRDLARFNGQPIRLKVEADTPARLER